MCKKVYIRLRLIRDNSGNMAFLEINVLKSVDNRELNGLMRKFN